MDNLGLYIHIPFCKRRCFYCHFEKTTYDASAVQRYVEALIKEIALRSQPQSLVDTIYIGGGSPSLLSKPQLAAIVEAVRRHFNLASHARGTSSEVEFTIEVNPEDVQMEKLEAYRQVGINRISIGTQSFIPADLEYLQRNHGVDLSLSAVQRALAAGFSNINIDYIVSLPGQTTQSLAESFSLLEEYPIPHVSAYILEDVESGEAKESRDNLHYFFVRDHLSRLGYSHYEVSNFCKEGVAARHNLKYWRNREYIGLGLSASGYLGGEDYKNTCDFNLYSLAAEQGIVPPVEVSTSDSRFRRIVMGLRLAEGLPLSAFHRYKEPLAFLTSEGLLQNKNGRIVLCPDKMLLLNEVLGYF
ncbi:MAG: radical SAM family heme chaperone HemW [bacterium]|nr:radical SAM family heme chaperone HemW [bacterium]